MEPARSLSEEFVFLESDHDVLSLPDTTHSDGSSDSEGDSRGAAAIIEALEEGSTAQGVHMGVLPQFLGAWYGSSHIAAGHTYMVDLERTGEPSPPPSLIVSDDPPQPAPAPSSLRAAASPAAAAEAEPAAPAAPAAVVVEPLADDFEEAASFEDVHQHEVDGADAGDAPERIDTPTAVTTEPCAVSSSSNNNTDTAALEHAPAGAGFGRAALMILVSAATLATLVLFLLGAAAGVSTISTNTSSTYAMNSIDRHMFMVPAYHTTSTDTSKSPAAAGAYSNSYQPQHYSSRYAGPSDRLVTVTSAAAAPPALPARVSVPATAPRGQQAGAAKLAAPWWLGFNSSSIRRAGGRSGKTLRLPPLPPSLQRVVDGSARANITASQRLRLHLWLLHCAARNNMRLRAQQHYFYRRPSQVAAGRPANTSALPPFQQPFSSVSAGRPRLARPIPFGLQCAPSGTVQGWLQATANPAAVASPSVVGFCNRELAALLQPAAYIRLLQQYQGHLPNGTAAAAAGAGDHQHPTAGGVQHCNCSTGGVWEDGSLSAFLSFLQPLNRSAGSVTSGNSRRPCAANRRSSSVAAAARKAGGYSGGLLCPPAWTFACGAWVEPLVPCNASGALMVPAQHSITGHAPTATTTDSQPIAATASAAIQGISIVQPTRPVPPMYRPPLPCLLLGGPRTHPNNKTAFRPPSSQHATAHHCTAHRTPTWPNTTAHRRQGFMPNRVWGVRTAAKPYGRALSISMARWGWHQEAAAAQHKGSSSGAHTLLPMLPPVAAAATSPAVTNHTSGDKAAGGLTLPMLGVAQQQRQQQQKAKEDGAEQACQPAVSGGLTVPMLPPVVATRPPHTSSSTSVRQHSGRNHVCSAGSEFSSGLILVHHLEPPTAAKAAAAVNSAVQRAAKQVMQDAQDEDSADSVAGIKRQVWLYDAYDYEEVVRYAEQAADGIREAVPSSGCVTGCADMCHGAATLCSEVCVDKCFDVSGWHTITAADEAGGDVTAAIPLPPTTWSVPAAAFVPAAATAVVPLAAPLCVKNTSWGFVAAAAAAAARGKAARAMPAQQVKQGGSLVFPPVVRQRNATAACRGPQLLLPDIATAAKSAGRSSRVSASAAASNNNNKQDARWVSSFLALPMLPPTRAAAASSSHDHRGAVFAASAHGHIEKCVQDDAAHLQTPNNVTSDQNDMSFDDAVTQLWLSPVM